jgi:hypothetical protein
MAHIEGLKIESEAEADSYLHDLLAHPENRTLDEVTFRAQKHAPDPEIRAYLIKRAKEILGG